MFQVRIHGRGGQGVVSAAEMLSVAAFLEGKHAQAFPSFGSERMGAPVMAFCTTARIAGAARFVATSAMSIPNSRPGSRSGSSGSSTCSGRSFKLNYN